MNTRIVSSVTFNIPGEAKGKARARVMRTGFSYTPKETVSAENLVKTMYIACGCGERMWPGPIRLTITAVYGTLKSWPKKKLNASVAGTIFPKLTKPDADNIVKLICDALNDIAWKDDSQIYQVQFTKIYGREPCTSVTIHFEEELEIQK